MTYNENHCQRPSIVRSRHLRDIGATVFLMGPHYGAGQLGTSYESKGVQSLKISVDSGEGRIPTRDTIQWTIKQSLVHCPRGNDEDFASFSPIVLFVQED